LDLYNLLEKYAFFIFSSPITEHKFVILFIFYGRRKFFNYYDYSKNKNADSSPTYAPLRGGGLLGKKDKPLPPSLHEEMRVSYRLHYRSFCIEEGGLFHLHWKPSRWIP
jgi:hypothetical protein